MPLLPPLFSPRCLELLRTDGTGDGVLQVAQRVFGPPGAEALPR